MRTRTISIVFLFACWAAWNMAARAADPAPMQEMRYHGLHPCDPGGRNGLRNPERGLRIEAVFAEPEGSAFYWSIAHLRNTLPPHYTDLWWLLDAERYEDFGLTLGQMYCYLDRYQETSISAEKLQDIQRGFEQLRAAGLKAVLRFAYEKDMNPPEGPSIETILKHMEQLTPILEANMDVIYVLQAGFIGAWGEWHSSANKLEADHANMAAVVAKLLEILPPGRMTQVRVPKYKRWVLSDPHINGYQVLNRETAFSDLPAARIGFHNDGFLAGRTCGGTWVEEPLFSNPGNPEFDYMTAECPYLPVDGELFWSDIDGQVAGFPAAVRMRFHHYTSFSLAHSYSGHEGKAFGVDVWMKTPITAEQAREAKLPVSDGYFEDAEGQPAPRTVFEYIRDHLGYRLELQAARFPATADCETPFNVEIDLINRGFSVPINPRPVNLALADETGHVVWSQTTGADPHAWQPCAPGDSEYAPLTHTIKASITLPAGLKPGTYLLGLWLPDAAERLAKDARYAIRVSNRDVPWWPGPGNAYGVNLLGKIAVAPPVN